MHVGDIWVFNVYMSLILLISIFSGKESVKSILRTSKCSLILFFSLIFVMAISIKGINMNR